MEKRVYIKTLKIEEIIKRLLQGKMLYTGTEFPYCDTYEMINGLLIKRTKRATVYEINSSFVLDDDTFLSSYFIDEIPDPEADESCMDKLCKFWNENEIACVGVLSNITDKNTPSQAFFTQMGDCFAHCRALTKEEIEALTKKEN